MDAKALADAIESQGRAWEEFKSTNDQILKAKADGKAIGDLEAKLATISTTLDSIEEFKGQVEAEIVKMNRPSAGKSDTDMVAETKSFNNQRRANSQAGSNVGDIDTETYAKYKSAYWNLLRKGNAEMLEPEERKALQAGVDSDGGYLLPEATAGRIVKKVYELSPIRQIANVMTISTNSLEGINDLDEAAAGWTTETGTRSDSSTPTVGKYAIEAFEMYAMPKATQKVLDDSAIDIEAWLMDKVASKMARLETAAFVTGNGVGKPRGFTDYTTAATADGTRAWGTIESVKSGKNGGFTNFDYLFDLEAAFKTAYLANARFVTNRAVVSELRKAKNATTNEYFLQPGVAGMPATFMGYPITICQDMPTLTTGSKSLYFGDFREAYQIVDRVGIRTLRDPYTAKPYIVFYSTKRVGGGVVNFEAIKAMNFDV
jgi:HK97 family phage major capsid protein